MSLMLHLFDQKYSKTSHIEKYYCKKMFYVIYSCDGNTKFSAAITPVLSVTWSFRNHCNMLSSYSILIFHIIIKHENSCAA